MSLALQLTLQLNDDTSQIEIYKKQLPIFALLHDIIKTACKKTVNYVFLAEIIGIVTNKFLVRLGQAIFIDDNSKNQLMIVVQFQNCMLFSTSLKFEGSITSLSF